MLKKLAALAILVALCFNISLSAQGVPQGRNADEGVVYTVSVLGNQRVEDSTVTSYLTIRPGDRPTQLDLDASIKRLFATGLFADVTMALTNNILVVQLRENPLVNRIIINGNRRLKTNKLQKEIRLAPRSVYTRARLQADVQRIMDLYKSSGRFAARVVPKALVLPQNRVDVVFDIDEGGVAKIRKISFLGNERYADKKLRGVILSRPKTWWNFLTKFDSYDQQRIEYDQELLRQFYLNNGYVDFQVLSSTASMTTDEENFYLSFLLSEGESYTIGDVDLVTTSEKIDAEDLKPLVNLRTGDTYSAKKIEKTIEDITFLSGSIGYAFVDVRPLVSQNREENTIDLVFRVDEGPRVYIDRIDFAGNSTTRDSVLRRELRLFEGDSYNKIAVERSLARLRALDFFEEVEIEETPSPIDEKIDLLVKVDEKSTGSLTFSLGATDFNSIIGTIGYSERNLLGKGQVFNVQLSQGRYDRDYALSFTEPHFLGRNMYAGASIFYKKRFNIDSSFRFSSVGSTISLGFALNEYSALRMSYTLAKEETFLSYRASSSLPFDTDPATILRPGATPTEIITVNTDGTPVVDAAGNRFKFVVGDYCDFRARELDAACRDQGTFIKSALGYALSFDNRNSVRKPRRGIRTSFSQEVAGLGGDVRSLRSQGSFAYYQPLPFSLVGALKVNAGHVLPFDDYTLRINDRFFKGGKTFRGFEFAGIGPRYIYSPANNGRSLGGETFGVASLELLVPVPILESNGLSLVLFYELGTVGGLGDDVTRINEDPFYRNVDYTNDGISDAPIIDNYALRSSAGISIGWESPFGLFRFDYAFPLQKERFDEVERFSVGAGINF